MRDPSVARRLWQRLELVHDVTYFSPEALGALRDAGYKGFWMGYFAGRAAPLGAVGPEVVMALFYNFAPSRRRQSAPRRLDLRPARGGAVGAPLRLRRRLAAHLR